VEPVTGRWLWKSLAPQEVTMSLVELYIALLEEAARRKVNIRYSR
jgi:hypothetical protein